MSPPVQVKDATADLAVAPIEEGVPILRRVGLVLGPALFGGMLLAGAPDGLSTEGWRAVALMAWVAAWWVTEALPVAVTALLPLLLLPLLGIATPAAAASPYADPIIFLFIAGFMLAAAVERWGLHKRLAFGIALRAGTQPRRLVWAFLAATAALSMWISNTATALMMMPIAMGVAVAVAVPTRGRLTFAGALALTVAHGASIGGIGTPVGSPTNLVAMGFLERQGTPLAFIDWMLIAVPIMLLMLVGVGLVLGRAVGGVHGAASDGGAAAQAVIADALRALGPAQPAERRVGFVFAAVAVAWIVRPIVGDVPALAGLTDLGIALVGVLLLFLLPSGRPEGARLLDWPTAERIPWGIALLFGAGLSMAAAMEATGVTDWLGSELAWLGAWGPFVVLFIVVALVVFLTEFASNTATLTAMLPVVAALAAAIGQPALVLAVGASMAASLAFMLPIGTPPNAIAYATGAIPMRTMMRIGIVLNLLSVGLITLMVQLLSPLVLR
ncbi:MAG: SLC13 family permease [Silanimonas sp.]